MNGTQQGDQTQNSGPQGVELAQVKVEEGYYRLKPIKGRRRIRSLQEAMPYQARSELASLASPHPYSRMDVGYVR